MKSAKEALATNLGMDYSDLSHYNYKAGHYTRSVYFVGESLYCCIKKGQSLPKASRRGMTQPEWKEIPDSYCNKFGFHIYETKK